MSVLLLALLCSFSIREGSGDQPSLAETILRPNGSIINILERPVINDGEAVAVQVAFNVQQIILLDAKSQYLESLIWIEQYWTDDHIRWNPAQFGGVKKIRLHPNYLWRPDVHMYNSLYQNFDSTWPVNLVVDYTGAVSYIPPALLRSTCKVNVRWFPYDEQCCVLKFGSWTYDDTALNLTLFEPSVRIEDFIGSNEFDILSIRAERHNSLYTYHNGIGNYPFVNLCFHMRRLGLYYVLNILLPAIMVLTIGILNFCLPVESGEKIGLGVTVLLGMSVFTMIISDSLPRTSESTPLLGVYFTAIMLLCAFGLLLSVVVLNVHYFPSLNSNPPCALNIVCICLARMLRMRIPEGLHRKCSADETHTRASSVTNEDNANEPLVCEQQQQLVLTARLFLITSELQKLVQSQVSQDRSNKIAQEWRFAARVIDRVCIHLLAVFTLAFAGFMLFWRPYETFDDHDSSYCSYNIIDH